MSTVERYDTVIVGGGQAGLATGYHLARRREIVRDPRRVRPRRRCVAQPVELAAAVHPGEVRRPTRLGIPRRSEPVPDEGRDGRLPRSLRPALRAARAKRRTHRAVCRMRATGSSSRPPAAGSKRTASSSRPVPIEEPAPPRRPGSSIRGSSSSTRATTAAPSSWRTAVRSSSAPATRAPRSRSSSAARARPCSRAATSVGSRCSTGRSGRGSCCQ